VKFVLPAGFRGLFKLVTDPNAPPRDDAAAYEIPPTGVLAIRDTRPLEQWHNTNAVFDDHTPLPVASAAPSQPYDEIAIDLHHVTADSEGNIWFLVGTEAELDRVLKERSRLNVGPVT
jgi:hypothetical protein